MKQRQVLIVEDETIIARDIQRKLTMLGYDAPIIASSGEEAVAKAEELNPDLILMDIVLKGDVDGIEAARLIRERFDIPVVYLTAYADEKTLERAKVTEPFGYMLKPFEEGELHSNIEMALYRHSAEKEYRKGIKKIMSSLQKTVNALASIVELRDPYTAGHQKRVAELAVAIAGESGLSEDAIKGIELAALVHDIGKIVIPPEILNKPERISPSEFEVVITHAEAGFKFLKDIEFPWLIADMVLQHHERLDGSGYPRGLRDDQILLGSKIIAVADVVEAMSSDRPYRPAFSTDRILEELTDRKGELFCPETVDTCVRLFREKDFHFTENDDD